MTIVNTNTLFNIVDSRNSLHQSPLEASTIPPRDPSEGWGKRSRDQGRAAGSLDGRANPTILCQRCRRLTSDREELDRNESCEECKRDPELAHVAQKAALALSQLATTLTSGISSDQRAAINIIGVS
jgi:hypothetical protein